MAEKEPIKPPRVSSEQAIAWGQEVLSIEAEAIIQSRQTLGLSFADAVDAIVSGAGKVVVSGLGKSGHIGRKISATFASTGTASVFLHPSEALHGDLGILSEKDVLICIAYGGETAEVLEVARYGRRLGCRIIGITGKRDSTLVSLCHTVIDGGVSREACPLNLAPTASSSLALALGDALAIAVMKARGFDAEGFASLHPAGSLGRRFIKVKDLMVSREKVAQVAKSSGFHDVLAAVTKGNFGIAAVTEKDKLVGAITDGDLRRALLKHGAKALETKADEIMSKSPKTIDGDRLAMDAVALMEGRMTHLFVCTPTGELQGLIRMHDLLANKIV